MSAWIGRSPPGKAAAKIVPPDPRIPRWKGLGADSEEKREPASDIDTVPADSLKALDLDRPIREADVIRRLAGHRDFMSTCPRSRDARREPSSHDAFATDGAAIHLEFELLHRRPRVVPGQAGGRRP